MENKICENCGEKIHFRTQKCPLCNTVLTEASKIESDVDNLENDVNNSGNDIENNTLGTNYDVKISDSPENSVIETIKKAEPNLEETSLQNQIPKENVKDYVYKAEVHHSLEYTEPLPNLIKVILSAITASIPMFGQLIGIFFGVFFSTYEDRDRKSFGKALIILSISTFMLYTYTLISFTNIINSDMSHDLSSTLK